MSQETKEALRRFEQKMREQGADGFADGPRPWEHWDESGHQANNRIWEGSARRIYPRSRRARSLGHRLLSVLAFIALTTLLVGIGGVYFSHTQSRQLAETGVQPLPLTDLQPPAAMAPASQMASVVPTARTPDLEVLSAPAAGTDAAPQQSAIVIEPVVAETQITPAPDTTTPAAATDSETSPPATGGNIDSVAIETIVTEQSVTTTVYTRHLQQDEAEVVAAIETMPPPFAHRLKDTRQEAPESVTATPASADTAISSDAATEGQDAELQLLPTETPAATLEAQPEVLPENVPVETVDANETIAAADMSSETASKEPFAEVETPAGNEANTALTDNPSTEQAEATTTTARVEMNSETVTEVETAVSNEAGTVQTDNPLAEQAEAAVTTARVDTNSETVVAEPQSATADGSEDQPIESMQPATTPVAKTGAWVINLASYTRESTANRKLALFQQQGIDAEVFAVTVNDKPMYRIRVTGYASSRSAKADIPVMEEKLNLEGAWISRR